MQSLEIVLGKKEKPVEITHRNLQPQKKESSFCNLVDLASRYPPAPKERRPMLKLNYIDNIEDLRMEM